MLNRKTETINSLQVDNLFEMNAHMQKEPKVNKKLGYLLQGDNLDAE